MLGAKQRHMWEKTEQLKSEFSLRSHTSFYSAILGLDTYTKELKAGIQTDRYNPKFTATGLTEKEKLKCPPVDECLNKMWYKQENYLALWYGWWANFEASVVHTLVCIPRRIKYIQTGSNTMETNKEGIKNFYLASIKFLFENLKKLQGCTTKCTMQMHLTPANCKVNRVTVKFMCKSKI